MAVDIGLEATDRGTTLGPNITGINKDNPASENAPITSIDIWAESDITGLIVGTFYTTNGNDLKCRDSEAIAGTITAGAKVTKAVSIAKEVGDYIGCYFTGGKIECAGSGAAGVWYVSGEYIDPDDETTYTFASGYGMSLGGYIAVGRSFGFIIG